MALALSIAGTMIQTLNSTGDAMESIRYVGKLTGTPHRRREPDAWRRMFASSGMIAACLLSSSSFSTGIQSWHPTDDIAKVAESFLRERLGNPNTGTDVRVGMLDKRMKLANCDYPLEAFLRRGSKISSRTTIGIRCNGSKPWKIYLPVDVIVNREIWVARHSLPRGHLLTVDDLMLDTRDVSRMKSGYVADQATLVGQRLKSSILAGRELSLQLIVADDVIRRGQTVTLVVAAGGINIRVVGKALSDGAINQRIRVENLSSGRVIEGIVRSRELVEVLVPGSKTAIARVD